MRAEEEATVAASAAVAAATKAASTAARYLVEDAVGAEIQDCDPQQALRSGDFQDVLDEVSDKIIKVMRKDEVVQKNMTGQGGNSIENILA